LADNDIALADLLPLRRREPPGSRAMQPEQGNDATQLCIVVV